MLNTDKVRGIVRAKQGSQIPKFQNPASSLPQINPFMQGSLEASPKISFTDIAGPPDINSIKLKSPGLPEPDFKMKAKMAGKQFMQGAGDFLKQNGQAMFDVGLGALNNSFNNVENSKGVDTAFQAMDMVGQQVPIVKLWSTALKGINSLGGKRARQFSVNQDTAAQVGASYGGSMVDITNAAKNSGKKYGLFSGSKRRKANRAMDEAERQQNIMTDIADDARDMQALSGNEFNYTNYMFNMSGGYDQRYMRAAKSGMKLQDKIDFIKNEVNVNPFINLDTKEIEWNPIIEEIEEWEPVIEFKEGGSLPELWEPEIELIEEWEPIITDYVEEFKDGGSIKEELETPEIEETNQKNLIPEGALHKNKHHMEHTEGLTQKGIPVIDNDGEQQAEIELDEIIFTLEVTKKLEELYKEGTDEAAIEAGKLLVKEILFNTDDRTGLIAKCEKGGKINEVE